jgi:uncharacterized Zn-finger protein
LFNDFAYNFDFEQGKPVMASTSPSVAEITPNAENRYEVTRNDLPLSCPMPGMSLWNSHPKVYLPIEKTGQTKCPYCGADFFLVSKKQ